MSLSSEPKNGAEYLTSGDLVNEREDRMATPVYPQHLAKKLVLQAQLLLASRPNHGQNPRDQYLGLYAVTFRVTVQCFPPVPNDARLSPKGTAS
jgi:hypothetical protein